MLNNKRLSILDSEVGMEESFFPQLADSKSKSPALGRLSTFIDTIMDLVISPFVTTEEVKLEARIFIGRLWNDE